MTSSVSNPTALMAEGQQVRRAKNPKSELKVEDFINMMVTQLQNQDPLEPAKNDQLLAQMSQIGQLQSAQELQNSLKSLVLQNNLGAAGNMIGKLVEGVDALGKKVNGEVTSVRVEKGNIMLELDSGKQLELSKVLGITQPPVADATDAARTGTGVAK